MFAITVVRIECPVHVLHLLIFMKIGFIKLTSVLTRICNFFVLLFLASFPIWIRRTILRTTNCNHISLMDFQCSLIAWTVHLTGAEMHKTRACFTFSSAVVCEMQGSVFFWIAWRLGNLKNFSVFLEFFWRWRDEMSENRSVHTV